MSRYPEVQTRPRARHLTHFTLRRQELGSVDAGFLRRAGGTAPFLPTQPGRRPEEYFSPSIRGIIRRLIQFGDFKMWNELNPTSAPNNPARKASYSEGERDLNDSGPGCVDER
jgi:hypothetical protein